MTREEEIHTLKQEANNLTERLAERFFAINRALYQDPELSLEEVRASQRLTEALNQNGFQVQRGVADLPTSFVALSKGALKGAHVGLLAEYDALPGVGHGCGHNLIAASAVGAALVLSRLRDRLPGQLSVIGTPAEETIGGKALMVRKKVFQGLDAAMMIHPGTEFRVYTTSLACQSIQITFEGKAAHAVAAPDRGVNALDPLVHLYLAIDTMRRGMGPEVRIPGVILEGGERANIVPSRAVGRFSVRARSRVVVEAILERIQNLARGLAAAHGARFSIMRTDEIYDEMLTNPTLARLFKKNLAGLGVETVDTPRDRMGSLDMGNVSQRIPSLHAFIGIVPPEAVLHTREFADATVSEGGRRGLLLAVKALAMTAIDLLTESSLVEAARQELLSVRSAGAS